MRIDILKRPAFYLIANAIVISAAVLLFANKDFPLVGHDYNLAIPQMLDAAIHYRRSGLAIQWYSPSFGGGLPAFPNPNNGQFTLLEILTIWIQPWRVVALTTALFVSIGLAASYRLLRVLRFHETSAILGAVFFSANGFVMERIAVGHLGYQPFPVLSVVLLLLLDDSVSVAVAGLALGLTTGVLIHQAGYFLLLMFCVSVLITLPLVSILRPGSVSIPRILGVGAVGAVTGLVIAASKIAAVAAFMRFFPRTVVDDIAVQPAFGVLGILVQLLGTMTLGPGLALSGLDSKTMADMMWATTGIEYFGYWELDMSLTPVVFLILVLGTWHLVRNAGRVARRVSATRQWPAVLMFLVASWAGVELTLARGYLYPWVRNLPILSSLHMSGRSTAAFLFPLSLAAAFFYDVVASRLGPRQALQSLVAVNLVALVPLAAYFAQTMDLQNRNYDIRPSVQVHRDIVAGKIPDVTTIGESRSGVEALASGFSNINPYEPIFGYHLESFHPEISTGSIWKLEDGHYNMTDPSGYVFPEHNGNRPFERFRAGDEQTLERFARHEQADWKIPRRQRVLDAVSAWSFVAVVTFLAAAAVRSVVRGRRRRGS